MAVGRPPNRSPASDPQDGGVTISKYPQLSTFSIVAHDPAIPEWGAAVQSKFLAVGAIVPWARWGAGALATQARGNVAFGPHGLSLMDNGVGAEEVLDRLLAADGRREFRQVGLMDAQGNAASFTGTECQGWAGSLVGRSYAVQGNLLAGAATVEAMARAFEEGRGELGDRLVTALAAGQRAGRERRGQQAAALLVVREKGGYDQVDDRYIDLRVDDARQPIDALYALLDLHHLLLIPPEPDDWEPVSGDLGRHVQRILSGAGLYSGPVTGDYNQATGQALKTVLGMENLEERFREAEGLIDRRVLALLQRRY